MAALDTAAALISVAALSSWVNHRFIRLPSLRHEFPPRVIGLLTWGGLRGGISIALALSLPAGPERGALITVTYVVVVFSILVQGLTLQRLLRRAAPGAHE